MEALGGVCQISEPQIRANFQSTNLPEKNPNHSAQAYFGYHKANHSKLESLATKYINKRMPIATSNVHSQSGKQT